MGKNIWITGASTGIGKALAIKFADEGWNVAVSARRENLLVDLCKSHSKIHSFPLDVIKILENTDNVIVIEEHSKSGGLGSIFNDIAAENNLNVRLNFIGFENKQLLEYGSRDWFHKEAKIDFKSLTEKILRII